MAERQAFLGPLASQVMRSIRALREARRMSFNELGRLTGIPPLGLRRLERGERRLDVDELAALAAALDLAHPWDLTREQCLQCSGLPPAGFTRNACGKAGAAE